MKKRKIKNTVLKIAYLSSFHPYRGGIAQFNTNLYDALQKDHKVWAYNFSRQYPGILFPGKSQYVNRDEKNWSFSAMNVLDSINPLTYYSAARKIATKEPDLLLLRYWMPFFAPSLGTVAKKLKKKCFYPPRIDGLQVKQNLPWIFLRVWI